MNREELSVAAEKMMCIFMMRIPRIRIVHADIT